MNKFGLILFTLIEDSALIAWLVLVRSGQRVGGVATLVVGFFLEHVIAYNVKRGTGLFRLDVPKGLILVNALFETFVVWVPWLLLWEAYSFNVFGYNIPIYAILYVYPALVIEHSMTDAIFKRKPILKNLWNPKTIGFSLIEGAGCNGWLLLVGAGQPILGAVVLVVFQYTEHRMAIQLGRATS